jgi:hypothetical protein
MDETQNITVEIPNSPSTDNNSVASTSNQEIETPALAGSKQHAEVTGTASTTEAPQEEHAPDGKGDDLDVNRIKGKVSKLESENNQLKKTYDNIRGTAEFMEKYLQGKPEAYEEFRNDFQGKTGKQLPSYEEVYGSYIQQTTQPSSQNLNPWEIAMQVAPVLKEQQDYDHGVDELWKNVPEINPHNITDLEERREKGQVFERVHAIAETYKRFEPEKSWGDALKYAWNALPENIGKQIENAQKTGEIVGKQNAYASGSGTTAPSGGSSTSPTAGMMKINLTPSQHAQYERIKNRSGEQVARRFLQNLSQ